MVNINDQVSVVCGIGICIHVLASYIGYTHLATSMS